MNNIEWSTALLSASKDQVETELELLTEARNEMNGLVQLAYHARTVINENKSGDDRLASQEWLSNFKELNGEFSDEDIEVYRKDDKHLKNKLNDYSHRIKTANFILEQHNMETSFVDGAGHNSNHDPRYIRFLTAMSGKWGDE